MSALTPILILAVALLAVFFEASFDAPRRWLGAQVDLLPGLMVYVSLSSNLLMVLAFALVSGFALDSLSANPPGATVLPLLVLGALMQRFRHLLLSGEIYAQWLLGLGASAGVPLCTVLLLMVLGGTPLVSWGSVWQWLVMAAVGSVLTPLYFLVFDQLRWMFGYRPVQETSFRPDREIARGRN